MSSHAVLHADTASLTDIGRVRSTNQDCCAEFEDDRGYRLLIVADGMGGHRGGEVASRTVVETVGEVFRRGVGDPAETLHRAFLAANGRVHELASQDLDLSGMGTTGVALLLGPSHTAWIAHVGDSRLYRLRGGRLELLTEDHSWVYEEVRRQRLTPEEAAEHPRKNVLTRSLGVEASVRVDVASTDVDAGDRFLLCSDGLWGEVPADQIAQLLGSEAPARAVQSLVALANRCGGPDNITVQVACMSDPGNAAASRQLREEVWPEPAADDAGWHRGRRFAALALAAAAGLLAAALMWRLVDGAGIEPNDPGLPRAPAGEER
jgi:protein phosphatase